MIPDGRGRQITVSALKYIQMKISTIQEGDGKCPSALPGRRRKERGGA